MSSCSEIYSWQGGRNPPSPRPECPRKVHAKLIRDSGKMLFEARKNAYSKYVKECHAWGRDPMREEEWFMYANGECGRFKRGEYNNG